MFANLHQEVAQSQLVRMQYLLACTSRAQMWEMRVGRWTPSRCGPSCSHRASGSRYRGMRVMPPVSGTLLYHGEENLTHVSRCLNSVHRADSRGTLDAWTPPGKKIEFSHPHGWWKTEISESGVSSEKILHVDHGACHGVSRASHEQRKLTFHWLYQQRLREWWGERRTRKR